MQRVGERVKEHTMKNLPDEFYEAIRAFYELETLEEAKQYERRMRRLGELVDELRGDVDQAIEEMEDYDDDQFSRRTYVRTVFAMIEGAVFALKQEALEQSCLGKFDLSSDDLAKLAEKSGYLSFRENIKFTFPIFARAFGETFKFDPSLGQAQGWRSLCQAKEVRDHLMHPKSVDQLEVNDSDLSTVKDAAEWVEEQLDRVGEISWGRIRCILSQGNGQVNDKAAQVR